MIMPRLTFYHQVRFDGGRRTGISVGDDATSLHFFQPGAEEEETYDPRLLWYVDVRCDGDILPSEPQAARDWFLANETYFVAAMGKVADTIAIGVDSDIWPYQCELAAPPDRCHAEVAVQAVRRLTGREIADNIRGLAANWCALFKQLEPLSVA
jgi:hypothetical protein